MKAQLPKKLREWGFRRMLLKEYVARGASSDTSTWPFELPPVDLEKTRFVPNEKVIPLLIHHKIPLYSRIKSIKGQWVAFQDGCQISVDTIILATGYKTNFSYFDSIIVVDNYVGLYKHVFHPDNPHLAFVGMANIVGAAFPLMEMQSRFIARVFIGRQQLPSLKDMHTEIHAHKIACDKRDIDPMRVQALGYLDEIAALIGVRPQLSTNLTVFKELVFGPLTAFRYRLNGPHSKPTEAKAHFKSHRV